MPTGATTARGWPTSTATGVPEFSAFDERFVYEYTAYVFSSAPIQIWSYHQGSLVDVTRDYPALIEKSAATNLGYYNKGRGQKDVDVRSYVAAYVADQYLLGDPAEAQRLLELALKRGDLGDKSLLGLPAGTRFVAVADARSAEMGLHHAVTRTVDSLLADARAGLVRLTPEQAFAAWQDGAMLVDTRSPDQQHEQQGDHPRRRAPSALGRALAAGRAPA